MSNHNIGSGGATFEDLAIDDTLTDLERVVRYVHSNIALQRVIHVRMLEDTAVAAGFEKTCEAIIPVLEPLVSDVEFVVRQHVAGQFPGLCKHLIKSGGDAGYKIVLEKMMPMMNKLLTDVQAEVRHIASESLVTVAELIKPEDQGQHVLTLVLPLAHEDDDEQLRITALILLNKLAVSLGGDLCCQFCVPEFISLSEDPVFRVRKAIALNYFHVCETAGPVVTQERLLPAYQRLAKDDIWGVRKACAESLSDFSKTLTPSTRAELLAPLFTAFSTDASKWVRIAAYQQLGPFIATLPPGAIPDALIKSFSDMATQPSVLLLGGAEADMKFHCAYNYPAVALTLGREGWPRIAAGFDALSRDGFWKVRRTLAFSLHEMAHLLGPDLTETHLVPAFGYFLEDIDDVKSGSIQHFADFLAHVPPAARGRFLPELAKFGLLQSNPKFKLKWRFRSLIADQLPKFCTVFDAQAVFDVVAPLVFQLTGDDVAHVRDASFAAMPPLHAALRGSDEWTTAIVARVVALKNAASYLSRQIFLHMARAFLVGGPEHVAVFESALAAAFFELATDPVLNVRLLLVRIVLEVGADLPASAEGAAAMALLEEDASPDVQDVVAQLKQQATTT
ncbi:Aste57867_25422 [Aphanomyces stellatus]|uniref:Aste57867_25422 protein n=1 Tax=Aphanomyces stellatus TaxID=120398 RepID=A0A485LT84_9STRA|nr:hypothetical protein As57867_025343 [Aphanomyces stellatus]VFU02046.1 Aste57867_25422 [Aphanomyces stellatus]